MANHNVTRYDPFSPFGDLARLDPFRDFDELIRELRMRPYARDTSGTNAAAQFRIDVAETDNAYIVKADAPGLRKEDINVAIDGNQVTISAETKRQSDQQGENLMRSERYVGRQYRSFTLPSEVDETQADATYQDGVLALTLPKRAGGRSSKQVVVH